MLRFILKLLFIMSLKASMSVCYSAPTPQLIIRYFTFAKRQLFPGRKKKEAGVEFVLYRSPVSRTNFLHHRPDPECVTVNLNFRNRFGESQKTSDFSPFTGAGGQIASDTALSTL